jgi:peptide/nickel transport system substrate-binding protein
LSIKARLLAGMTLLVALVVGLSAVSAKGQGEPVTFDVGDPSGIDSMSPLVGITAAAVEAWNIQYATLTDKAAEDFHTIPALAESWKGSKDKLTWTYKLRDGLKWSDGKPLTSEDIA